MAKLIKLSNKCWIVCSEKIRLEYRWKKYTKMVDMKDDHNKYEVLLATLGLERWSARFLRSLSSPLIFFGSG